MHPNTFTCGSIWKLTVYAANKITTNFHYIVRVKKVILTSVQTHGAVCSTDDMNTIRSVVKQL